MRQLACVPQRSLGKHTPSTSTARPRTTVAPSRDALRSSRSAPRSRSRGPSPTVTCARSVTDWCSATRTGSTTTRRTRIRGTAGKWAVSRCAMVARYRPAGACPVRSCHVSSVRTPGRPSTNPNLPILNRSDDPNVRRMAPKRWRLARFRGCVDGSQAETIRSPKADSTFDRWMNAIRAVDAPLNDGAPPADWS